MSNVLRISEAASLALHTATFLAANPGRWISTREVASVLNASEAHLSKVLQRLTKAGLVKAVRGPGGGVALEEDKRDVRLLDVYEAIEGPLPPSKCLLGKPICGGNCILGNLVGSLNEQVRNHLANTRLSDLSRAFKRERIV